MELGRCSDCLIKNSVCEGGPSSGQGLRGPESVSFYFGFGCCCLFFKTRSQYIGLAGLELAEEFTAISGNILKGLESAQDTLRPVTFDLHSVGLSCHREGNCSHTLPGPHLCVHAFTSWPLQESPSAWEHK